MPEITGAGCGVLDYDNDGDLDVILVQGGPLDRRAAAAVASDPAGPRLFRNQLSETGRLGFVDATEGSGLPDRGYGMGVATGDFDNDGWTDLYLTNLGPNFLLRNAGGRFQDVTAAAGAGDARWSIPAVFFDFDADGWLDLFVGNYVDFSVDRNRTCLTVAGERDYCGPHAYRPVADRLLRNRGDGSFEDVTLRAGFDVGPGPAMGAGAADFDGDGRLDLYVSNDGKANHLWLNLGDGRFEEVALLHGAAVSGDGIPQASMGTEVADFDGDGDEDLFLTHLTGEMNALYVNQGNALFQDRAVVTGLGASSLWATGFGVGAGDFDGDGAPDLLIMNGAVRTIEEQARGGDRSPFRQRPQIYRNSGHGDFEELTAATEPVLEEEWIGRGLALGDLDNDGDLDALVLENGGRSVLLLNRLDERRSAEQGWLGLRLVDRHGRDALGARVSVRSPQGRWVAQRVGTAGSFASAHDPRLLFPLGTAREADLVRVEWPDGGREEWTGLAGGRYQTLRQTEDGT